MSQDLNLGLNSKDCLKYATEITHTAYYDVCTGAKHLVPHGIVDFVAGGFVFAVLLAMLFLLFVVLRDITR